MLLKLIPVGLIVVGGIVKLIQGQCDTELYKHEMVVPGGSGGNKVKSNGKHWPTYKLLVMYFQNRCQTGMIKVKVVYNKGNITNGMLNRNYYWFLQTRIFFHFKKLGYSKIYLTKTGLNLIKPYIHWIWQNSKYFFVEF